MKETLPVIPCVWSKVTILQRLLSAFYADAFRSFGLTNEQVSLLFILSRVTITTQKELCMMTGLEKSTISRNLVLLLDRKLVQSPDGDRHVAWKLTPAGKKLLGKIYPHWMEKQAAVKKIFDGATLAFLDEAIIALKQNQ